jgi:hypothetical protein
MSKDQPSTSENGGFGSWVRLESKSIYVRASVLVATAQLINSALAGILSKQTLGDWAKSTVLASPRWLTVATHGFQAVMVLILLIVLVRLRPAGLLPSVRARTYLLDLQQRFYVQWTRLWIIWLLLYLGLLAFAFLKQVEIDTLSKELPSRIAEQLVWFNRMHEEEDIKQFSYTLAFDFEEVERRIADGILDKGFDVRLMSTVNDVSGIPTEGKLLIIVAAVNKRLHFRIFDGDGKRVVDTNEEWLTKKAQQKTPEVEDLRLQLKRLWSSRELTKSEKDRVSSAVMSIVDYTQWSRHALGLHDLPYLVRDRKQVEILKNIIYYVTARESSGVQAEAGEIQPANAIHIEPADLGDKLPDYLSRVSLVDQLTLTMKIERALINFINNIQTYQFFVCYLFLLQLRPKLAIAFPYIIGLTSIGILAVVEITLISTGVGGPLALKALTTLSSIASGVIMALFVGRLESQVLRAPLGLIVGLYAYAILQMGWEMELTSTFAVVINSLIYFSYAILKVLMFLFLLWLLKSGKLLYYFQYRLHSDQTLNHSIRTFLEGVVPSEAATPGGRSG